MRSARTGLTGGSSPVRKLGRRKKRVPPDKGIRSPRKLLAAVVRRLLAALRSSR